MAGGRFRLLEGKHAEKVPGAVPPEPRDIMYVVGDVFDSNYDLDRRYNAPGYPPKFERVSIHVPTTASQVKPAAPVDTEAVRANAPHIDEDSLETFSEMSVQELQAHAISEEIDIAGCNTKEELIARIAQGSSVVA